jgi:RimJ/RimL family protein N-acetyltransferase
MSTAMNNEDKPPAPGQGPAYRIETARLCIRCWNPSDAYLLKDAVDPNMDYLRPWMPWVTDKVESVETRAAWLRKSRAEFDLDQDFVYGVFNPGESEVVGGTGLHTRQGKQGLEVGYWIQQKYEGRGYATEVASALTKVAFEVNNVKRVHICCSVANMKSARIPEKLGFQKEGVLRKRVPNPNGQLDSMIIWTMIEEEYPHSACQKVELQAFDAVGKRIL